MEWSHRTWNTSLASFLRVQPARLSRSEAASSLLWMAKRYGERSRWEKRVASISRAAYLPKQGVVLAQMRVDEKSHEITMLPNS